MLTGKEIVEKQVITNYEEGNVQQQGIDVRVNRVFGLGKNCDGKWLPNLDLAHIGWIPKEGKTKLPREQEISPSVYDCGFGWLLQPGYYEIEFWEGCKVPNDCCMEFKTRSSVVRCGGEVRSGLFDAGFETKHMGAFLKVEEPMFIACESRLAQVIVHGTNKVENTYNGQWQNDNQRK